MRLAPDEDKETATRQDAVGHTRLPRFRLYDDDEIGALPGVAWLIDGLLPRNGLGILVGEKGGLKSFLALDLAAHVCLGLDWHGRQVFPGSVVYVYAEGQIGIRSRIAAWKAYTGVQSLGLLVLPQRVAVNELVDVRDLLEAIEARHRLPTLQLVIVDTLNRNMTGNENSSEDMSAFVRGCDGLRETTGAAVLVVHHVGHGADTRSRGSSVLEAAADTVILCSRDNNRITLECQKQKDAAEFEPLAFEAVRFAGSLVLTPSGVTSGGLQGQRLHCVRVLHEDSTDAGLTYSAWKELSELKPSSFNKARQWLREKAYVASHGGKWKITDAGTQALRATNSTNSTTTPPTPSGVGSHSSTPLGGYVNTPRGGVE